MSSTVVAEQQSVPEAKPRQQSVLRNAVAARVYARYGFFGNHSQVAEQVDGAISKMAYRTEELLGELPFISLPAHISESSPDAYGLPDGQVNRYTIEMFVEELSWRMRHHKWGNQRVREELASVNGHP